MNALSPTRTRTEPERMKFTLADVDALVRAGVMAENARVELIDGDLILMASEGGPHVRYKVELNRWLTRALPEAYRLAPDATLRLAANNAPEPDLYVYPADLREEDVRGADTLLVIEIADTTQAYDLRRKAELYARFDVPEYWVVDVPRRTIHVHMEPGISGYVRIEILGYEDVLTPKALPFLSLRLADLERLNS